MAPNNARRATKWNIIPYNSADNNQEGSGRQLRRKRVNHLGRNYTTSPSGFTVLGPPVGSDQFVKETFASSQAAVDRIFSSLQESDDVQLTYYLHCSCSSACKIMYLLRTLSPT